ncbi:MAG: hypothetical protein CMJ78_23520 [Planctomycetaceae bacterium]|nr:hypothetical protein [Planctomycetaceae bacterium]
MDSLAAAEDTPMCYGKASQIDSSVEFLYRQGQFKEAVFEATPITKYGMSAPPVVPYLTYCYVMLCHMHLGEIERALEYQKKALRIVKSKPSALSLYEASMLLTLMVRQQDCEAGVRHFEESLPWAVNSTNQDNICLFYNTSAALFEGLAKQRPTVKLRLHNEFP